MTTPEPSLPPAGPARSAGLLLHPTSLPGPFGTGDLGPAADAFLDWAVRAGLRCWQVLPLGPTGPTHSPYVALSAFAGHPLLISPERLADEGVLARAELGDAPCAAGPLADFALAAAWKGRLLRAAWERWPTRAPAALRDAFETFRAAPAQAGWLADWGLFRALRFRHGGRPWTAWDPGLRRREPGELARARAALAGESAYHEWLQFLFERQWARVHARARALGVTLFGDLPIYVAHDSADVWVRPELFALDAEGRPTAVAGVPPDYFSETGQLWGNPLYRWERLADGGYAWWVERVRANLRRCDLLRLDHFRAFAAYWEVPATAPTAAAGRWVPGPGVALFDALRAALGELPLVAEDLGLITEDVHALRRAAGLPCMRVLQFGFDGGADNPHHPRQLVPDAVVYTGTHDNDTARGWFAALDPPAQRRVLDGLGGTPETVHRDLLAAALRSPGFLAVAPLQDVLGLGSEARMNVPGRPEGNWAWRATAGALGEEPAGWLAGLVAASGR